MIYELFIQNTSKWFMSGTQQKGKGQFIFSHVYVSVLLFQVKRSCARMLHMEQIQNRWKWEHSLNRTFVSVFLRLVNDERSCIQNCGKQNTADYCIIFYNPSINCAEWMTIYSRDSHCNIIIRSIKCNYCVILFFSYWHINFEILNQSFPAIIRSNHRYYGRREKLILN